MENHGKKLLLEGDKVYLEEISNKYFPYIVQWRNDEKLNKFLNQKEILTLESQEKWYKEFYLKDAAQGFMVIVEKGAERPFAAIGWTDMDADKRQCVAGRLVMPDSADAELLIRAMLVFYDYLFTLVDTIYIHVAPANKRAMRWNKSFGYKENREKIQYAEHLNTAGIVHIEMMLHKEEYLAVRKQLKDMLGIA